MNSVVSVVEAAGSRRLTTVDHVTSELRIVDAADTAAIERWIDQASSAIETFCSRVFAAERVIETFDLVPGDATRPKLVLKRYPVFEVVSVICDGAPVDPDAYRTNRENGMLRLKSGLWRGSEIIVDYRAGYRLPGEIAETEAPDASALPLPSDIESATIQVVNAKRHASRRDPLMRAESLEGISSMTFATAGTSGLPRPVEAALQRYKAVL